MDWNERRFLYDPHPGIVVIYSPWVTENIIVTGPDPKCARELHTNNPYQIIFMISGTFDEKVNTRREFAKSHLSHQIEQRYVHKAN